MRVRNAAALALAGWFLMTPPGTDASKPLSAICHLAVIRDIRFAGRDRISDRCPGIIKRCRESQSKSEYRDILRSAPTTGRPDSSYDDSQSEAVKSTELRGISRKALCL